MFKRLKIRKPPTEFQDVCLKPFCAVRATPELEDFNVEGLTRNLLRAGVFIMRAGFRSPLLRYTPHSTLYT